MAEYEINLVRRNVPSGLTEEEQKAYDVPIHADTILFRYAAYGLDGIIKGYGNELEHDVQGSNFIIKSGMAVIQGNTIEVLGSGVTINTAGYSTDRNWLVYIEISRAIADTESAKIIAISQSGLLFPTMPIGDDLTVNPQGIARVELYRFRTKGAIEV